MLYSKLKNIILAAANRSMRINIGLLFIGFILSFSTFSQTSNKVALIVAVSNYDPSTGWDNLSSEADVKLITEALKKQGFKSQDIAIIRDKDATLQGITAAIDKHLVGKVKKDQNDVAVFHFSGHGQQMLDDNGDEGDGLDEALVPYDAPLEYKPGENKHLRDDLLEKKLNEVRLALGSKGNLLVVVDACHSGTSTRGGGKTRGSERIYAPEGKAPEKKQLTTSENFGITGAELDMAPMTSFFASGPFEQNAEASLPGGEGCGSLSLAFSRALAKADNKMSYKALFEDIKIQMSALVPQQTPMAEGDLDKVIIGGKALPKTQYFLLEKKDDLLTIPVGTLYGIYEGTTVKLYPADTRDTAAVKPIATGKISTANVYNSILELDRQLTATEIQKSWLYLGEINYGDLVVQVKLNIADISLASKVKALTGQINQMKLSIDAADLFIQTGAGFSPDSVYITTGNGLEVAKVHNSASDEDLKNFFTQKIGDYARAAFLRKMDLKNANYNIAFEFVPLVCISGCGTPAAKYKDGDLKSKMDSSGHVTFKVGDRFRLNIINQGNNVAYYTVIDIQPDNIVNVLVPGKNERADEFKIFPSDTIRMQKVYKIGPPYGVDVIKVVGSDTPIDLRTMFASRGALTRGDGNKKPFEKLMQGTYNAEGNRTRGSGEDTIQPDAVNILTVPYKIIAQ